LELVIASRVVIGVGVVVMASVLVGLRVSVVLVFLKVAVVITPGSAFVIDTAAAVKKLALGVPAVVVHRKSCRRQCPVVVGRCRHTSTTFVVGIPRSLNPARIPGRSLPS
jgi:hypothetical protein